MATFAARRLGQMAHNCGHRRDRTAGGGAGHRVPPSAAHLERWTRCCATLRSKAAARGRFFARDRAVAPLVMNGRFSRSPPSCSPPPRAPRTGVAWRTDGTRTSAERGLESRCWSSRRTSARFPDAVARARAAGRARPTPTGTSAGSTPLPGGWAPERCGALLALPGRPEPRPGGKTLYPGPGTTGLCAADTFEGQPLYAPGKEPGAAECGAARRTGSPTTSSCAPNSIACAPSTAGWCCGTRTRSGAGCRAFRGRPAELNFGRTPAAVRACSRCRGGGGRRVDVGTRRQRPLQGRPHHPLLRRPRGRHARDPARAGPAHLPGRRLAQRLGRGEGGGAQPRAAPRLRGAAARGPARRATAAS